MTLPWFLVALALQIDLQAFIKAASGYAGKKLLDNQLHMCVRLNTSMFVGLCYFMWLCVCVCLRLGPRLLPEVEFHSLLFHYSYKATAPLHRVQSCKNFFPLLSSLLGPPFLFFLFYGYSWNGTKHLCKLIFFSPFWDLRQKQSWTYHISNTFYINQYFFKLKQLLNCWSNCWSKNCWFFSSSNYFIAKIFSSSSGMFYLMVLHSYISHQVH